VATPAIAATATVTPSTTATTSAERSLVEAVLRAKTGRAGSRLPAYRRPESEKRWNQLSCVTRRLARRGWPTGANAPSIAMVSFGKSTVGTRTWTGHPLTITSNEVAALPSGVLPEPRTILSPPIATQDHWRSTLGSSASVNVQPVGSTFRSNAANLPST
jgi:hypothetical protein